MLLTTVRPKLVTQVHNRFAHIKQHKFTLFATYVCESCHPAMSLHANELRSSLGFQDIEISAESDYLI